MEKYLNSRIVHKHDTEENWNKATNFIPKKGELIVYDKDSTYDYERFKIGDGVTVVSNLAFATYKMTIDSTLSVSGNAADAKATGDAISNLSDLVGDVAVSEQISNAVANKQDGPLIGTIDTTADNYITPAQVIEAINSGRDVIVTVPSITLPDGSTVDNIQLTTVNTADNGAVICSMVWNNLSLELYGNIVVGWSEPSCNNLPSPLLGNTITTSEMYLSPADVADAMSKGTNVILATMYNDEIVYLTSFTGFDTGTDVQIMATGHMFNSVIYVWATLSENTWSEATTEAYATRDKLEEVSNLVGDTSVFDQISAATIAITNAEIDEICGQTIEIAEDVTL